MQYYSQPMSQWGPYYPGEPNYMPYVNGYQHSQGFGEFTLLHNKPYYKPTIYIVSVCVCVCVKC